MADMRRNTVDAIALHCYFPTKETNLMSTETNKAVVRRVFDEMFKAGNMALAKELFAPDFVNHDPNRPDVRDRAGLTQGLQELIDAFPDNQTTIDALIAEGEYVTKRYSMVGTHRREWNGIPATGKRITIQGISIYRIVNGKIVEMWWGYDSLGILQQLGVVPEMA
jgi:steroid delta-isomerase-like uncharacterized protein